MIALCGGIVLEEALDLSFDRLLMMMMMMMNAASGQSAVHVCRPLNFGNKFVHKGREDRRPRF